MALATTIKELLLNLLIQQREFMGNPEWIDTVYSEIENSTQSAIYKQARAESRLLISNDFYPSGIPEYDLSQCRVLFNWYNTNDFLSQYNSDKIYFLKSEIGGVEYNKNDFLENNKHKNLLCYLGTGEADGKIDTYTSDPVFSFYRKSTTATEFSKINGVRFNQFTYANDFFVGCPKPIGGGYAIQAADALFQQSIDYSAINSSLSITTNESDLDLYAAMHLVDYAEPDGNYLIVDNDNPKLYHIFRIYNKNTVFSMFKLWDLDIYYKSVADLNAGTNFYSFSDLDPEKPDTEKTEPGQEENISKTEGGTGTPFGDTITHPEENTVLSTQGLMNSIYCITAPQLQQFNNDLWTWSLADIEDSFVGGYLSALQGCFLYPLNLPFNKDGTRKDGVDLVEEIVIGKKAIDGVTGTIYSLNSVYYPKYSFGILDLKDKDKYFGGFLDFTPYTKFTLYLPYIGYKDIDPCKIWNHRIELYYIVDLTLGSCKAVIEDVDTGGIFYEFTGQIGSSITVSKDNTETIFNSMIVGGAIKAGTSLANSAVSAFTANKGGQQSLFPPSAKEIVGQAVSNLNPINALGSSLSSMVGAESPSSSGGNGTSVDRFTTQEAYFIIQRPKTAVPENYNQCYGRPSLITTQLKNLKGFTTCPCPIVDTTATEDEKTLINNYLNAGVRIL